MSNFLVQPGEAIQGVIDRAAATGGGTVTLASGVHNTRTVFLRSHIELHFEPGAVLRGPGGAAEYPLLPEETYGSHPTLSSIALIAAAEAEDIAITGGGVIDGRGPEFYDRDVPEGTFFYRKPATGRPRLLQLVRCRDIRIESVEFRDSPGWTTWLIECENLQIRGIRILGDPRMINNDGIHLFGGRRVTISDCIFSTGDDCIVLRAGHAWTGMTRRVATEDVVVTNSVLESSCQGIRVGCTCDDTIRRCRFSNLTIRSRNVGIYLDNPARYLADSAECVPETVEDISFDHIRIESGTKALAVEVDPGVRLNRIRRITFSNIDFRSREPVSLCGSPETPLEEIRLVNVRGTVAGPEPVRTRFVRKLIFENVEIESAQHEEQQ